MASALATEQPTINKAWEHFVVHVPTILLIWIASVLMAGVGVGVYLLLSLTGMALGGSTGTESAAAVGMALGQLPFTLLSNLVCVLCLAVPALFYERGETITVQQAFAELFRRPLRYFLAGLLFALVSAIGFVLCILPGIAVMLVMPVFVNRIFVSDQSIPDAFAASFQAVYRSPHGLNYVALEVLTWLLVLVVTVCTCGLGAVIAVPVSSFYLPNAAYHQGLIS